MSCLLEATSGTTRLGVVVVVVVVVVVLGVVLGGGGGGGLSLFLVVLSTPFWSPDGASFSFRRSTQHLIWAEGHPISSLTSSHKREAKACKHLPGHSLTSAVLVMEPSNPVEKSLRHFVFSLIAKKNHPDLTFGFQKL